MSKWTTVRVDKETAERLRGMAGGRSVSALLEEFSKSGDVGTAALANPVPAVTLPTFQPVERTVTQRVAKKQVDPEVQRDTPAYVDVSPVQALTPGAEAAKCYACGKLMARPKEMGMQHDRGCRLWRMGV